MKQHFIAKTEAYKSIDNKCYCAIIDFIISTYGSSLSAK